MTDERVYIDQDIVCDWLVSIGYGFDFADHENPLPWQLRKPLAAAWYRHEKEQQAQETVEDYYDSLKDLCGWA